MCLRDVSLVISNVLGLGTVHDLRACFWEAAYPPRQLLSQVVPSPSFAGGSNPDIPIVQLLCDAYTSILFRAVRLFTFFFFRFLFTIIFPPVIPSLSIFLFSFCSFLPSQIPISRTICVRWMTFIEFLLIWTVKRIIYGR